MDRYLSAKVFHCVKRVLFSEKTSFLSMAVVVFGCGITLHENNFAVISRGELQCYALYRILVTCRHLQFNRRS